MISSSAVMAQTPMKQKLDPATENALDRAEILRSDIASNVVDLTSEQWDQVKALNKETMNEINEIPQRFKDNDEIYENKVRLILEKRDARMSEILNLRQYAIYLNGQKDDLRYDSKYKSDDLKLKTKSNGNITAKTDEGKIKINDEEIKVKNELRNTKWEYTAEEVMYKDEDADVKLEIEDDKVRVKTREKKEKIQEDEALLKKDDAKIKIEEEKEEDDASSKK